MFHITKKNWVSKGFFPSALVCQTPWRVCLQVALVHLNLHINAPMYVQLLHTGSII